MKNGLIGERIVKLSVPAFEELEITLTNGNTYRAHMGEFSRVYCYPRTPEAWAQAFIGEDRIDVQWPDGFAVHLDQIVPRSNFSQLV